MRVLKSVLCATTAVGVFVLAGNAQAADNAADTATVEELIVTAEAVSRANNVVSLEVIDTLAGGQNIVDALTYPTNKAFIELPVQYGMMVLTMSIEYGSAVWHVVCSWMALIMSIEL